jgi:hypothetical protein
MKRILAEGPLTICKEKIIKISDTEFKRELNELQIYENLRDEFGNILQVRVFTLNWNQIRGIVAEANRLASEPATQEEWKAQQMDDLPY